MDASAFTPETLAELFRAMGVGERAKRRGDAAPDVTLLDSQHRPVRLRDQWRAGQLIVVFFRGGWCNYCNLQLRAWQMQRAQLSRLGARLLAISPQAPEKSIETTEENSLAFPVLSDANLTAAAAFGIAFTLPPELIEYFSEMGTDIPVLDESGQWALPVPATYVIDTQGIIQYADVEPDYRKRPSPADTLLAIAPDAG